MFCRKCGKILLDGDRFCPYCGAQVIEREYEGEDRVEEEVVYNGARNYFSETVKPKWKLDAFPKTDEEPKKTEEIRVDWEKNKLIESQPKEASTISETPEFLRNSEVLSDIKPEKKEELEEEAKANDFAYELSLQDLLPINETEILEKSEEEKIIEKAEIVEEEEPKVEEEMPQVQKSTLIFERPKKTDMFPKEKSEGLASIPPALNPKDDNEKFYTFSQKNEEFQKLLDKEYERIRASKEAIEREMHELEETLPQIENVEELSQIEIPEEIVPKKIITPKFEIPASAIAPPDFPREGEPEKAEAPKLSEIETTLPELEDLKQEPETKPEESQHVAIEEKFPLNEIANEAEAQTEPTENTKEEESKEGAQPHIVSVIEGKKPTDAIDWEQAPAPFADEVAEKKLSIFAILLGIIVLVLGISILALTIEQFSPNSLAGKAVHTQLEKVRDFFRGEDANAGTEKVTLKSEEANQDEINAAMMKSMIADKKESLKIPNIKDLKYESDLKLKKDQDYSDTIISESFPFKDEAFFSDSNGIVHTYKDELIAFLLKYENAAMDYKNLGNEDIFFYVKTGSPAYDELRSMGIQSGTKFSLEMLKIGEIRQNGSYFLIWISENEKVSKQDARAEEEKLEKVLIVAEDKNTFKIQNSIEI